MEKNSTGKSKFKAGRIKVLILVGVAVYAAIVLVTQQSTLSSQLARQEELRAEEAALEREIDYYNNSLSYIGTNEYVEQQARERFGWLMEDEIKYVEATDTENAAAASTGDTIDDAAGSAIETENAPPADEITDLKVTDD